MPKPPQSKTEWKDQYTLLCESCGYILEGLDQSLPCPECAKPITESLPERRVGTHIQCQDASLNSLKTWWMTFRHPLKTLDIMRFNLNDHEGIALINITLSTTVPVLALFVCSAFISSEDIAIALIAIFLLLPMLWATLMFLTAVEAMGLRFLGSRKGFRVTHSISNNIVAHGSVGWVIGGLGSSIGILFIFAPYIITVRIFDMHERTRHNQFLRDLESTGIWLIPISILLGFLFFEIFAYKGLRRCKYANTLPPKSHPQKP